MSFGQILKKLRHNAEITQKELANALVNVSRNGEKNYSEVITLCNQILEKCTDNMIRYQALNTLVTAYSHMKNKEEMKRVAMQIPATQVFQRIFYAWAW